MKCTKYVAVAFQYHQFNFAVMEFSYCLVVLAAVLHLKLNIFASCEKVKNINSVSFAMSSIINHLTVQNNHRFRLISVETVLGSNENVISNVLKFSKVPLEIIKIGRTIEVKVPYSNSAIILSNEAVDVNFKDEGARSINENIEGYHYSTDQDSIIVKYDSSNSRNSRNQEKQGNYEQHKVYQLYQKFEDSGKVLMFNNAIKKSNACESMWASVNEFSSRNQSWKLPLLKRQNTMMKNCEVYFTLWHYNDEFSLAYFDHFGHHDDALKISGAYANIIKVFEQKLGIIAQFNFSRLLLL